MATLMSGNCLSEIQGATTSGTISTAAVRFILGALQQVGADPRALMRRAGLPACALEDNTARVPRAQLASVWRLSLAELGDPYLGLRVGCQWRYGALGLYDYLFATAATLGEGLTVGARYIGILNGASESGLVEEGDRVTHLVDVADVPVDRPSGEPDISPVMTQCALTVALNRVRHATGREITPVHVGLATAAPPRHRDLTEVFGTRRIDFGQARSTLSFARSDLGLPLPHADPRLAAVLLQHAATVIAAPASTPRWIDRFRQILATRLDDRAMSLSAVARRLGMSPRTMQRRLEREGTGWREEIDALRYERATRLLRDGMPRGTIAARLGYSDTRVLRAAIRRWNTGRDHPDH